MRIWTIGHSTRTIDDFISLLKENEIDLLADVRAWPSSKRYPHFNKDALAESLNAHGIRYEHFSELGGKRKSKPDSRNTAWRNASFRGYADYMETEQFQNGIERLLNIAGQGAATWAVAEKRYDGSEAVTPWGLPRGGAPDYAPQARGYRIDCLFQTKFSCAARINSIQLRLWTLALIQSFGLFLLVLSSVRSRNC